MEVLFKLFGPMLLIVGIISFFKRRKFAEESTVVIGTVIEIRKGPAKNNKTAYYPVIRYLDQSESSEQVYESSTAYEPSKYHIGDKVGLRYLNDGGKKQLCLDNWSGIWGLSFMLTLFGFIFCVIDFALFFLRK